LSLLDGGALAVAADYAAEGRARRLVDFDDHLDDISRHDTPHRSHGSGSDSSVSDARCACLHRLLC
jgi:hypothetical protein